MNAWKPIKVGESRAYEVEGMTVVLRRVEPTYFTWRSRVNGECLERKGNAQQKSRYEIIVNDEHLGWLNCPSGIDKGWQIVALGRSNYNRPWVPLYEMEEPYYLRSETGGLIPKADRDGLIAQIPEMIRRNLLVTREQMDAMIVARRLRDVEEADRRANDKREAEERRRRESEQRRIERIAERAALVERIDGLRSLVENKRAMMDNLEVAAVEASLDFFQGELARHDGHTLAFHSNRYEGR